AAALGRQLAQVGLADVQLCPQGQGDGAPAGVLGQGGECDPDVAVDVLRAGGAGAGGVVDATALDTGGVAGRGRVVDAPQQALGVQQRSHGRLDAEGHVAGLATGGAGGGVVGAEVVGDAGRPEPGGDGAAAAGKQQAAQQHRQADGRAPLQPAGQVEEGGGQQRGQV